MAIKSKNMKEAFFKILEETGWEKDRYGNYKKELEFMSKATQQPVTKLCRVKVQDLSVRIEIKCGANWFRKTGDYYSRMVTTDDGRIRVGAMFFGEKRAIPKS